MPLGFLLRFYIPLFLTNICQKNHWIINVLDNDDGENPELAISFNFLMTDCDLGKE